MALANGSRSASVDGLRGLLIAVVTVDRFRCLNAQTIFVVAVAIAAPVLQLVCECVLLGIRPTVSLAVVAVIMLLALIAFIADKLHFAVLRNLAFAGGLLIFGGVLHPAVQHIGLQFDRPLISSTLARADMMLGFDWIRYHDAVEDSRIVGWMTRNAYNTFAPQLVFLPIFLSFRASPRALLAYFGYMTAALTMTDVIFLLWPADNAAAYWGAMDITPMSWHASVVSNRDVHATIYDLTADLSGLVTFPSFHTAGCCIILWNARKRRLLWPLFALDAITLCAIPAWGGHYLVDVVAGVIVAALAISIVDIPLRWPQDRMRMSLQGSRPPSAAT
jgi:PAP2 superfamily